MSGPRGPQGSRGQPGMQIVGQQGSAGAMGPQGPEGEPGIRYEEIQKIVAKGELGYPGATGQKGRTNSVRKTKNCNTY